MPGLLKFAVYITIAIIIFFMFRKKQPKPSQFDMGLSKHRAKRVNKNALTGIRKVKAQIIDDNDNNNNDDLNNKDLITHNGKRHNVWQVLGIPSGASEAEIKKAFAERVKVAGVDERLVLKAYKKALSLS